MSTTIIDALLVTIGLEPKTFVQGAKVVEDAQNKVGKTGEANAKKIDDAENKLAVNRKKRNQVNKTDQDVADKDARRRIKSTDADEEKLADARRKRSREVQQQERDQERRVKAIKTELLGLFALWTAGKGIKDFIGDTITSAAGLGFLSQNLRMSTEDITAWGRAAERAGGSKDGMIAQLRQSAADIAALKSGMGPSDSMQWFFRMGGSSSDLKDGNTYLLARAKIVHDLFSVDPTRAALISSQMGISEDQFNLIKQGPAAILALVEAQRKNSAISEKDAAAALELRNRWLDFKASLEATTTKILVASIPAFEQIVKWLESLMSVITDNKDAIGQWTADFVGKVLPTLDKIGKAISEIDWTKVEHGAREVGNAIIEIAGNLREAIRLWNEWTGKDTNPTPGVTKHMGAIRTGKKEDLDEDDRRNGRKPKPPEKKLTGFWADVSDNIEIGLARTLASFGNKSAAEFIRDKTGKDDYLAGPPRAPGTLPPSAPSPTTVSVGAMQSVVAQFMKLGWTREQAIGLASNFAHESGMNPAAVGDNGKAYGIGQWHPDRQAAFKRTFGKDIRGSSVAEQVAFANYELRQGAEQEAGRKLAAAKTAAEAAAIASHAYERPKDAVGEAAKRAATAAAMDSAKRAGNAATGSNTAPAGNVKTDVKIGQLIIQTKATDAAGIARDLPGLLEKNGLGFAMNANTGLA